MPADFGYVTLEALASLGTCALLLAVTLPPGLALLRWSGAAPRAGDLGVAALLGTSVQVALALAVPSRWIALAVVVAALLYLWPHRMALAPGRAWLTALIVPTLAALYAVAVNGRDVELRATGLAFRAGFEISDRVYYAALAQELQRAPLHALENPAFGGAPLVFSMALPALGLLLHELGAGPLLWVFLVRLPAACLFLLALVAASFVDHVMPGGLRRRVLAVALIVLGGDLSFFAATAHAVQMERVRHFFAFYSFGAEALTYNPWMLALPLVFGGLALAHRYLEAGGLRLLAVAALPLGLLWQAKPFAFLPLLAGLVLAAGWSRKPRVLALAGAMTGAGVLAALPTALGAVRLAAPQLAWAPLVLVDHVRRDNLLVGTLSGALPWPRAAAAVLTLVGALGVRVLAVPVLLRLARAGVLHAAVGAACVVATAASLLVVGRSTWLEGVQFLMLPLYLAWPYAAVALLGTDSAPRWRVALGVLVAALAAASPIRYAALKIAPPAGLMDGQYLVLGADAFDACAAVGRAGRPGDVLLLPRSGPYAQADLPLAVLSGVRLAATPVPYHVPPALAAERRRLVDELYAVTDAAEGARLLAALGVDWIFEDPADPLRFPGTVEVLRTGSLVVRRVGSPQ